MARALKLPVPGTRTSLMREATLQRLSATAHLGRGQRRGASRQALVNYLAMPLPRSQ